MEKKYLINIKDEDLNKILGYIKTRKKSDLITKALKDFFNNIDESGIEEFVNPIYKNEFLNGLKEIKKNSKVNKKEIENSIDNNSETDLTENLKKEDLKAIKQLNNIEENEDEF